MTALSCSIPMDVLTGTYAYTFDALVLVRVSARNMYGFGTPGYNLGSARIRSKPAQMAVPVITSYSDSQIVVSWTDLTGTDTGNSPITSYNLYWNDGTGDADIQVLNALVTSYTFGGISGGLTYKFKVRAKNIYDYGTFSNTVSIVAVDVPGKVGIPSVTLSGTNVVIDWDEPNSHYSTIVEYDVQFQTSTAGTFTTMNACKSSLDATILTNTNCTVDMLALKAATGLSVDSLIKVKIAARNGKGYGAYSEMNSAGALIEDKP